MTCKISELRKQMESMQTLLDTYEHCHIDSVTPEEKVIARKVKQACINAVTNCDFVWTEGGYLRGQETCVKLDEAIKAITDVE